MTGVIVLDGTRHTITLINDANYTTTASDEIIVYTAITANRTVTAGDTAANLLGQELTFVDGTASGSFSTTIAVLFAVKAGSGNVIKPTNGTAGGRVLTAAGSKGTAVATASGVWTVSPSPVSTDKFALGTAQPMNALYTFTQQLTLASLAITGNWQFGSNNQTISTALTLTATSPVAQYLVASGGDQTVNLPFTGACVFFLANVGASNNLIVKYNSGATTLCVIPPGGTVITYCSTNSPFYQIFGTNCLSSAFVRANLTAQAAAITATTLYAVTASNPGVYRVSWDAVVTQAATTSSTLGGANGFQVTYTDADTGVSVTTAASPTSTGNTVGTTAIGGTLPPINVKASTTIQFTFGYTSSGATPMQFALHPRLEYLG